MRSQKDISWEERLRQSRLEAEKLLTTFEYGYALALAVRASKMPFIVVSANVVDYPIIYSNAGFLELTGYEEAEVIGQNCRLLQGERTSRETVRQIATSVVAAEPLVTKLVNYRKDGSTFMNALHIRPIRDAAGVVTHFFGTQMAVSSASAGSG
ncbi:PAS domain-containing protein [Fulvimarina sp. 2208YS6-2-32]|uniref:PAS domain-containing protein n=1 Tax=Fulvimarina uroteuthidis TaxID=3098149 RepID=A0ABU5I719_9HYPH|nr:PAS domain-containing protein [Fulvimarina sp. 2208YS6-2-32]MDY8111185.1 PAS domain-containing protein [Fulvimarina sp. 2208YS6-2-32]